RSVMRDRKTKEDPVKPSLTRTLFAGLVGGFAFWVVTFLTFVLVGSGLDQASGPLVDPRYQSPKLIAVWSELEPLPLFATAPHLILAGYVGFGIVHALVFRSVQAAWPAGRVARTWRLALVIWMLSCLFFELFGPLNLLAEPLPLVALELVLVGGCWHRGDHDRRRPRRDVTWASRSRPAVAAWTRAVQSIIR
ncbi:MAG: hypothetical protein ACRDHD_09855, partial [Candidatus Limnocylindria bacterium]